MSSDTTLCVYIIVAMEIMVAMVINGWVQWCSVQNHNQVYHAVERNALISLSL